jgi:hypothetical protein
LSRREILLGFPFPRVAVWISTVYASDGILGLTANSIARFAVNGKEKEPDETFLRATPSVAPPRGLWYDVPDMDAVFPCSGRKQTLP